MVQLTWLAPGDPFPPAERAWGADSQAPGLLAAGGALDVPTLLRAYRAGIFPWYGQGQPVLWWSPDPRMVLDPEGFRLHRSLRKTLQRFWSDERCEIRTDSAFATVIRTCARVPRKGQAGTWIVPEMVAAYESLHCAGHAHSIETWVDGALVGGLYGVAIGAMFFGESMFSLRTDASKIALAALVALARAQGIALIDCQQNTAHLASLGAREIARSTFLRLLSQASARPKSPWQFDPVYWNELLPPGRPSA